MLWLARSALKAFVDGPEVTPSSGGWPDSAGAGPARPSWPVTEPARRATSATPPASATGAAAGSAAPTTAGTTAGADGDGDGDGKGTGKARKAPGAKKASRPSDPPSNRPAKRARQSSSSGGPPAWVVPNGTAEVLQTHPVKVKLSSKVYRVPGMPMYDRTVADRCYPTVETAEADGFTRAAR